MHVRLTESSTGHMCNEDTFARFVTAHHTIGSALAHSKLQYFSSTFPVQQSAMLQIHCMNSAVHTLQMYCCMAVQMQCAIHFKRGAMHFERSVYYHCTEVCTSLHWKCTALAKCIIEVHRSVHFTALEKHCSLLWAILVDTRGRARLFTSLSATFNSLQSLYYYRPPASVATQYIIRMKAANPQPSCRK